MKYYAVKNGRHKGVYTTWKECEAEIKGFKGAVYKSFPTKEEAEAFAQQENIKYIETSAKTGYNIKEAFNELYTDIYNIGKDDIKATEENIKIRQSIDRRHKKKKFEFRWW